MARFKYDETHYANAAGGPNMPPGGEKPKPIAFKFRHKDGLVTELRAPNQATGFVHGEIVEVADDPRLLRHLSVDPRFTKVG